MMGEEYVCSRKRQGILVFLTVSHFAAKFFLFLELRFLPAKLVHCRVPSINFHRSMPFTIAEISEIFAFMMAFALLESLAVTGFLVLLSGLLPPAWLRDGFALKGLVVILVSLIDSIAFQQLMPDEFPSLVLLGSACLAPLILIGLLLTVLHPRQSFKLLC